MCCDSPERETLLISGTYNLPLLSGRIPPPFSLSLPLNIPHLSYSPIPCARHGVTCLRYTLEEIGRKGALLLDEKEGCQILTIEGREISVVYYRCGVM
jgi:hypothetical protein